MQVISDATQRVRSFQNVDHAAISQFCIGLYRQRALLEMHWTTYAMSIALSHSWIQSFAISLYHSLLSSLADMGSSFAITSGKRYYQKRTRLRDQLSRPYLTFWIGLYMVTDSQSMISFQSHISQTSLPVDCKDPLQEPWSHFMDKHVRS